MKHLQVRVFMNKSTLETNRRLFERVVTFNDACSIDFQTLIKALNILFGDSVIISFNIN